MQCLKSKPEKGKNKKKEEGAAVWANAGGPVCGLGRRSQLSCPPSSPLLSFLLSVYLYLGLTFLAFVAHQTAPSQLPLLSLSLHFLTQLCLGRFCPTAQSTRPPSSFLLTHLSSTSAWACEVWPIRCPTRQPSPMSLTVPLSHQPCGLVQVAQPKPSSLLSTAHPFSNLPHG